MHEWLESKKAEVELLSKPSTPQPAPFAKFNYLVWEFHNSYWEKIKQSTLLLEIPLCFLVVSQSLHAKVDPFIEHAMQVLPSKVLKA